VPRPFVHPSQARRNSRATWTFNGRPIGTIAIPSSSSTGCVNDAHLFLSGKTRLIYAWWTYNGEPISVIQIPGLVNDMHWYGYPTKNPGVVEGITRDKYR